MWEPQTRCEAFFLDVNGDGAAELVLVPDDQEWSAIFRYDGAKWVKAGSLPTRFSCPDIRPLLRAGDLKLGAPRWSDIDIGGVRLDVIPASEADAATCPKPE